MFARWCIVLFSATLLVSDSLSSEQTLDEYVAQAAKANAGMKAAFENWQSALSKVSYASTLPDPKISYGHFIESVETRVGPQKFRLGLSQMIPWIGKLSARKDLATQQAVLEELELNLVYVDLSRELREAFFDYQFVRKSILIQKDYIDLARVLELTAQSQSRVGGSGADAIQAQMELNSLEYHLVTLMENELTARARINAILNLPVNQSVGRPLDIDQYVEEFSKEVVPQKPDALDPLNPKMRVIDAKRKVQESKRNMVHKNRYPDVALGVNWVKTDRSLMPTPESGKDPIIASVSITLPIWRSSYRSQEKEVESQVERFSQIYRQHSYRLQATQQKLIHRYSDAKRRVELFRDSLVPEAEQALSILTESYKTGRSDFERLQNAQIMLLKLQLKLERARADLGIAVAHYQAMIGEA